MSSNPESRITSSDACTGGTHAAPAACGVSYCRLLLPAAAALLLYLATLQRGLSLPDSAVVMEAMQRPVLSAFACNHTLNNLIGWLVCRLLPFGTLAWRCNAVSALYGAVAVALFHALTRRLGASRPLAALCTASLAVSHGVWWHATVVENYLLSAIFFLACGLLLTPAPAAPPGGWTRRRYFALGFLAGLSLLNHLQNGLLLVGCLLAPGRRGGWRAAGAVLAGVLPGAAPYLGLAVWEVASGRAGGQPLAWLFGGGGFGAAMFRYAHGGGVGEWARLLVWNHPGPFLVAVIAGLVWTLTPTAKRCAPLWRLVWVVVLGNSLFFLGYATWDRFSFFLAVWVAADVAAAGWLAVCERYWPVVARRVVLPLLALGVALAPLFYTWQTRRLVETGHAGWLTRPWLPVVETYRHRFDLASMLLDPVRRDRGTIEEFLRHALAAVPSGAVWVDDGSTYDQALWLQREEALRPDVEVLLLSHPLIPQRGEDPHALAMRCQWERTPRRWFVVTDQGTAAAFIGHLRPFGWHTRVFPVGNGRRLIELLRTVP